MLKNLAKKIAVAAVVVVAFAAGLLAVLAYTTIHLIRWAVAQASWNGDPESYRAVEQSWPPLISFLGVFAAPSLLMGTVILLVLGLRAGTRRAGRLRSRRIHEAARTEAWQRLFTRRDEALVRWSRYETDVALMIDYPVMTDYSDPVVREVIVAMQGIRAAEAEALDIGRGRARGSKLERAVDRFEVAFLSAENHARRCGQSKLSGAERSRLAAARQALNIILDTAAPPSEIDAAYRSLRSSLRGIIDLPAQAIVGLKARTTPGLAAPRPARIG